MSKIVECTVELPQTIDRSILNEAITLMRRYDNVMLIDERDGEFLLQFNDYGPFGAVTLQIKNGQLSMKVDDMIADKVKGILKQKYIAAYIARKTKARMKYDEKNREMILEVPI